MNKALQKVDDNLRSRLDNVQIPNEIRQKIANTEAGKTIRGAILSFFNLDILEKVLNTAESIESETNEYKKGLLMSAYMDQVDDIQEEVNKLENFVISPEGNILFSKVIRIINNNPQSKSYSKLLAECLKKIINSNFKDLFSKHVYALNQIEKLTPQALILLADYGNWPEYQIRNYSSNRGILTSEWIEEFLLYYAPSRGITDNQMTRRIAHALKELQRNGFIQSRKQGETDSNDLSSLKDSDKKTICEPTELGLEILEYIDSKI